MRLYHIGAIRNKNVYLYNEFSRGDCPFGRDGWTKDTGGNCALPGGRPRSRQDLVQSLAHTLGVEGEVTSPTFNLMNVYEGICPIYHFDLYRLETEEELEDIGFYEYTEDPEGIVVIEWSDKFPQCMPEDHVEVRIEKSDDADGRRITFASIGERYQEFIKELESFVYLSH